MVDTRRDFKVIHVQSTNSQMLIVFSGGSRNFKTGGGGGPGAVEFLGLGFVLMPLHI